MAEQKQDKSESVLTDKEKFQDNRDKDKIGHMGDKPGQSADQPPNKKK